MNAKEFVAALEGKEFVYSRTSLALMSLTGSRDNVPKQVTIEKVVNTDVHMVLVRGCWNCYSDNDCLFTCDYGVYVAVVKSGAGHLWCDRFVPPEECQKAHSVGELAPIHESGPIYPGM